MRYKQKNPETASPRGAEDCELFPGAMSEIFLPDLEGVLIRAFDEGDDMPFQRMGQ